MSTEKLNDLNKGHPIVIIATEAGHEVYRSYCKSIHGDYISSPWSELSEDQRKSRINNTMLLIDNFNSTPEEIHTIWYMNMINQGWKYGPEFNEEEKMGPFIIPYDKLLKNQIRADEVFDVIVRSVIQTYLEDENYRVSIQKLLATDLTNE